MKWNFQKKRGKEILKQILLQNLLKESRESNKNPPLYLRSSSFIKDLSLVLLPGLFLMFTNGPVPWIRFSSSPPPKAFTGSRVISSCGEGRPILQQPRLIFVARWTVLYCHRPATIQYRNRGIVAPFPSPFICQHQHALFFPLFVFSRCQLMRGKF